MQTSTNYSADTQAQKPRVLLVEDEALFARAVVKRLKRLAMNASMQRR